MSQLDAGGSQNRDSAPSLGALLVELRRQAGRSQREQADALSQVAHHPVTRNDLSRWEHETRLPTPWWQQHLAASFGVPVETIRAAVKLARRRRRGDVPDQPWTTPEAAGDRVNRMTVTGDWWASWQTTRDGVEKIATQPVHLHQDAELVRITATQRGLSTEEGGYLWTGELRFWDNEIFTGWYAAADGTNRSKGTMYLLVHPHGIHITGRWVGLGYDGDMTGWATMARTAEAAESTMTDLISTGGPALP